ncbi:MAG: restriction endonuclease [Nitrososphaerota archaeon]|nr:restriction endonuclease [Nitrososphaerota archaeon]MDG7037632.1 restriction endonuclease [Nitrososphaerota archaeon]
MDYNTFGSIFNKEIFEQSKPKLIETIAGDPKRYIGLFRPTKPKGKLLQNLLQSHEIRMGNAFEVLLEKYFNILGYSILQKKFTNEKLDIDQCFRDKNTIYFIEQKMRDDHDSTKKRGQIDNFEKKLNLMINNYQNEKLIGIFYFIDPDFRKNENYYKLELSKMKDDYGVDLYLFYGKELFDFMEIPDVWNEIFEYLKEWKNSIPELPELNFDVEPEQSFNEIKDLSPAIFRKLFENKEMFKEIVLTLFPQKKTLNLLLEYFKQKRDIKIYMTLYSELNKCLSHSSSKGH